MALLDSHASFLVWVYDDIAEVVLVATAQSPGRRPLVATGPAGKSALWNVATLQQHISSAMRGAHADKPIVIVPRGPVEDLIHIESEVCGEETDQRSCACARQPAP